MKNCVYDCLLELDGSLREQKSKCDVKEFCKKYDHALGMVSLMIESGEIQSERYEKLKRYVSDSLPWTEAVLKSWNRFEKAVHQHNLPISLGVTNSENRDV